MKLQLASPIWMELGTLLTSVDLKSLNISNNVLKTIPIEIYELLSLKTLQVSSCSLQVIQDLSILGNLKQLELDHNDLETTKINGLPNSLKNLNLSYNHIKEIPPSIISLSNLVTLNLNANRIDSTVGLGHLVLLNELLLDDNVIEEISEDISFLSSLKYLSIKRNKLTAKKFNSTGNLIQCIPEKLLLNKSLDRIDLEGNAGLTKSMVMNFKGVEEFIQRRRNNRIKNISSGAIVDDSIFGLD